MCIFFKKKKINKKILKKQRANLTPDEKRLLDLYTRMDEADQEWIGCVNLFLKNTSLPTDRMEDGYQDEPEYYQMVESPTNEHTESPLYNTFDNPQNPEPLKPDREGDEKKVFEPVSFQYMSKWEDVDEP